MEIRELIVFLVVVIFSASPAYAVGHIYISQVQITGGKNNTGNDFIEFFNASSSPVNLKGYRLVKRPGNANSDTLIKSWSKDAFIPGKSFYLWANSGYTTIAAKPDAVSSATIGGDSGIALRFGAVNSGEIVDAVSWGKTGNSFNNISAVNPGANLALIRKDLYQTSSAYAIAASSPRNSSVNDLAAAFLASQETEAVMENNNNPSTSLGPFGNNNQPAAKQSRPEAIVDVVASSVPAEQAQPDAPQVKGDVTDFATSSSGSQNPEPSYPTQSYLSQTAKKGAVKYLILSGVAFLALLFIAKKFLFSKGK